MYEKSYYPYIIRSLQFCNAHFLVTGKTNHRMYKYLNLLALVASITLVQPIQTGNSMYEISDIDNKL